MTDNQFANNVYYQEYEQLLIGLHEAMAREDEEESDRLRDAMDRPERALSAAEIARLNGLSADLYMLQNDEVYEPTEMSPEQLREAIRQAHYHDHDERLLALLRQGKAGFTQEQIALLRAGVYERLGHCLPALRFLHYAARRTNEALAEALEEPQPV